ncbi:DMT family transporter [Actinocorallia sp. B10E7]|uniref:DMT family transporter n=1 Tax=Actinocorallia sp. B10E7 TaxID=3153558 RepID=UPI00325E0104
MSRRGWVLFLAMSVIWGVPYLFIKVAVEEVSASVLVFTRTAVGALLLLPFALPGIRRVPWRRYWRPAAAFAALEIVISWVLLAHAEQEISSSFAGLLVAFTPVLSVLLAKATGGAERLSPRRWAGLALGFGGVALLAAPGLAGGEALAVAEMLLVTVCYATAPLIVSRYLQDVPSLPLTAVCLTGGALFYALPAALTRPAHVPSGEALTALAVLGVVCTGLAFVVFLALIREVGSSRSLVFTYVNPAVAVAAGVAFLDEPLTLGIAVAFVLILAGSLLAAGADPGAS